tara:strand:+ start:3241 stop:3672 length:432 start_codon:yes stop_codon:yes gene_type:complete
MKGWKQMAMSAVIGSSASGFDLYLADRLDPVIGTQKANLTGLAVDNLIDFIGQQQLFLGGLRLTSGLTFRFIVSKIITTLAAELLFVYIVARDKMAAHLEERLTGKKRSWKDRERMAAFRIGINVIVFLTLTYPLRKYWVFVK